MQFLGSSNTHAAPGAAQENPRGRCEGGEPQPPARRRNARGQGGICLLSYLVDFGRAHGDEDDGECPFPPDGEGRIDCRRLVRS